MPILRGIEPEMQTGMKKPPGLQRAAFAQPLFTAWRRN
jgi:hypothetical protein